MLPKTQASGICQEQYVFCPQPTSGQANKRNNMHSEKHNVILYIPYYSKTKKGYNLEMPVGWVFMSSCIRNRDMLNRASGIYDVKGSSCKHNGYPM